MDREIALSGFKKIPSVKPMKKCSRCNRELPVTRYQIYYYKPVGADNPFAKKEPRRVNNCKDCAKEKNSDTSSLASARLSNL